MPGTCGNCEAPLSGPYCAQCGQHARENARALRTLLRDGWDLITNVDGRFWLTVGQLLAQPGELTVEYFADRRARYISPLRLYVVLSVVYFALASAHSNVIAQPALPAPAASAASTAPAAAAGTDLDAGDCDRISMRWPWLQARLRAACRREIADNGRSVTHAFGSYVPKMMFFFLPLMALVLLPLYRTQRRYYVEHLVFFLHTHAAVFALMIADLLISLAAHWVRWLRAPAYAVDFAATGYAIWCIYRAMRRYYGEPRGRTLAKFAVVGITYQVFLAVMVLVTMLLSALTA